MYNVLKDTFNVNINIDQQTSNKTNIFKHYINIQMLTLQLINGYPSRELTSVLNHVWTP